jgi:hypothetical protein
MEKENPPRIFPVISEWITTALLPALFSNEALCSISALIIYKL